MPRCEQMKFERDKYKKMEKDYKSGHKVQVLTDRSQTEKDNLEKEITRMRRNEELNNKKIEQKLEEKQREINQLYRQIECTRKEDFFKSDYYKQKMEDERKSHEKELDELNKKFSAQPQLDKHRIEKETKEKLEKANADLKQARRELEETKIR